MEVSGRFTPKERTSGTSWIGDWLDLRASLDAGAKRKKISFLFLSRGSNPGCPARSLVPILTELPRLLEMHYTTANQRQNSHHVERGVEGIKSLK
jgi:hypothetical protein